MKLYDMIIDPISSPKAIDIVGERKFYDLYYQLKLKDLDFMQMILKEIEKGITKEDLDQIVNGEILKNNEFYQKINKQGMKLCENYELDYDAKENPFLR